MNGSQHPAEDSTGEVSGAVPDFTVVFGQGGGFAGRWSGYLIMQDGAVMSWSGRITGENAEPIGRLSPEERQALWEQVLASGFFESGEGETGNITASIEVAVDGRKHRTTWVPTVEGLEGAQTPVEELYRFALDLARKVNRTSSE